MDYLEDLQILVDVYYRLSEKRIFFEYNYYDRAFEEEQNRLVKEYIKNYCEKYDLLNKYNYLVDHIMLLKTALCHGREVQKEEFNGTIGLNDNDRWIKQELEDWPKHRNDDRHKELLSYWWHEHWDKSSNKDKFINEYGKEYINEIINGVEKRIAAREKSKTNNK